MIADTLLSLNLETNNTHPQNPPIITRLAASQCASTGHRPPAMPPASGVAAEQEWLKGVVITLATTATRTAHHHAHHHATEPHVTVIPCG